jgi:hypothetical protein
MQPMYYSLRVHKRKVSYCVKDGIGAIHSEGAFSVSPCGTSWVGGSLAAPCRVSRAGRVKLEIRFHRGPMG